MNAVEPDIDAVLAQINRVILGKDAQIRLCLTCLLARGHLLIEDIPGVGKTTLAHAIAKSLGLSFQRVQFTSDLLPADVLGVSIYDRQTDKPWLNAIALSGYVAEEDVLRSRDSGFLSHLTKPVSIEALDEAMAAVLDGNLVRTSYDARSIGDRLDGP